MPFASQRGLLQVFESRHYTHRGQSLNYNDYSANTSSEYGKRKKSFWGRKKKKKYVYNFIINITTSSVGNACPLLFLNTVSDVVGEITSTVCKGTVFWGK